jgi:hypothetical protein
LQPRQPGRDGFTYPLDGSVDPLWQMRPFELQGLAVPSGLRQPLESPQQPVVASRLA